MKSFFKFVAAVGFLFLAGGMLLNAFMKPLSARALQALETSLKDYHVELSDTGFEKARVLSIDSAGWENVSMLITIPKSETGNEISFSLSAAVIKIQIENLLNQTFVLAAKHIRCTFLEAKGRVTHGDIRERLTRIEGDFRYKFKFGGVRENERRKDTRIFIRDLAAILRTGETAGFVEFSGAIYFNVRGKALEVGVDTLHEADISRLALDEDDLDEVARILIHDTLTSAERKFISLHPVQAPRLFEIMEYARDQSIIANRENPEVPKDAYKHILWSYMMTKEFGETFTKALTDAHEKGDPDNTPVDNLMDYENNRLGRLYALRDYRQEDLLARTMEDPEVIRTRAQAEARLKE